MQMQWKSFSAVNNSNFNFIQLHKRETASWLLANALVAFNYFLVDAQGVAAPCCSNRESWSAMKRGTPAEIMCRSWIEGGTAGIVGIDFPSALPTFSSKVAQLVQRWASHRIEFFALYPEKLFSIITRVPHGELLFTYQRNENHVNISSHPRRGKKWFNAMLISNWNAQIPHRDERDRALHRLFSLRNIFAPPGNPAMEKTFFDWRQPKKNLDFVIRALTFCAAFYGRFRCLGMLSCKSSRLVLRIDRVRRRGRLFHLIWNFHLTPSQ
jgi:hypothetical protein